MVAHPLPTRPLRLAPLRLPVASRPRRLARRASSWLLAAAAIAFAAYVLIGALSSAAWWTFNSGPLTGDPEIVLTEPSPSGAVRVYGDTPELAPDESAAQAVDALDAEPFTQRGGVDGALRDLGVDARRARRDHLRAVVCGRSAGVED